MSWQNIKKGIEPRGNGDMLDRDLDYRSAWFCFHFFCNTLLADFSGTRLEDDVQTWQKPVSLGVSNLDRCPLVLGLAGRWILINGRYPLTQRSDNLGSCSLWKRTAIETGTYRHVLGCIDTYFRFGLRFSRVFVPFDQAWCHQCDAPYAQVWCMHLRWKELIMCQANT